MLILAMYKVYYILGWLTKIDLSFHLSGHIDYINSVQNDKDHFFLFSFYTFI